MRVQGNYGGVSVDVDFGSQAKWVFLDGDSGQGKSYLFRLLPNIATFVGIKVLVFDYKLIPGGHDPFKSMSDWVADIVCLDNADLYLTQKLLNQLSELDCQFLVSLKDTTKFGVHNYMTGDIVYEKGVLTFKEDNWKEIMYGKDCSLFRG